VRGARAGGLDFLLYPKNVHAGEKLRIFALVGVPPIKIYRGPARARERLVVKPVRLGRAEFEANEIETISVEKCLDLRDRELLFVDVEQQIAAFTDGEEVIQPHELVRLAFLDEVGAETANTFRRRRVASLGNHFSRSDNVAPGVGAVQANLRPCRAAALGHERAPRGVIE